MSNNEQCYVSEVIRVLEFISAANIITMAKTSMQRGCIAVYCLEGIAVHHDLRGDPQHLELIWFTVALQSQKLLIGAVYRQPSANNDILEYLDVNSFPKMTECGAFVHLAHWRLLTSITKTG